MSLRTLLEDSSALIEGHFRLSSGLHSNGYVQCALLLSDPATAMTLGNELASELRKHAPELVVAPALGGIVIGFTTAHHLGVPMVFTERKEGEMSLRRGFRISHGTRVAIVEDVVTTGQSTRETASVVAALGGDVIAIGSILNRSGETNPFAHPFHALESLTIDSWAPDQCPLCQEGVALETPGSRFRSS